MKKKLLIVGGGYGGLMTIHFLKNHFDVTLIDRQERNVEQTEIHRYLGNKLTLDDISFSFAKMAKKDSFTFILGSVEKLDPENKQVILKDGRRVDYEYLLLSKGAQTMFPQQIEGLAERKTDIKRYDELQKFKTDLDKVLESNESKNIVIAGAGLSGVEIALEISARIKKEQNINVYLIEQRPTVLPGLDPYLVKKATKSLKKAGVHCIHGQFISKIDDTNIYLANGEQIPYDLSLFVLGVISEKLDDNDKLTFNPQNQLIINDFLQVENQENIFDIGDFAQMLDKKGRNYAPTAQLAIQQGKILAGNLIRLSKGKKMIAQKPKIKGVLLDLEDKNAAGVVMGLHICGYLAWLMKRYVSWLYKTRVTNLQKHD